MLTIVVRFVTLILVVASLGACAPAIVPPGPTVPKELAAFSGKWLVGAWDETLGVTLIVHEIAPPGATVSYEWGTAPSSGVSFSLDRSQCKASSLMTSSRSCLQ